MDQLGPPTLSFWVMWITWGKFTAKRNPHFSILFLKTRYVELDLPGLALFISPGHWRLVPIWSACPQIQASVFLLALDLALWHPWVMSICIYLNEGDWFVFQPSMIRVMKCGSVFPLLRQTENHVNIQKKPKIPAFRELDRWGIQPT